MVITIDDWKLILVCVNKVRGNEKVAFSLSDEQYERILTLPNKIKERIDGEINQNNLI